MKNFKFEGLFQLRIIRVGGKGNWGSKQASVSFFLTVFSYVVMGKERGTKSKAFNVNGR